MILIEKNGIQVQVPLHRLHEWTEALFRPALEFVDFKQMQKIIARGKKLKKRGELSFEQLWLGNYFKEELRANPIPKIRLKWIDDRMGWGIFAEESLKSMEFIAQYSGVVRKRRKSDETNAYCFEYLLAPGVGSGYLIDAQDQGGVSRYINHGEKPNLASALATWEGVSHVVLYTNRVVERGEELRYDYGEDYWKGRGGVNVVG